MTAVSNDQIFERLGELSADVRSTKEDVAQGRESRNTIHKKLDDAVQQVAIVSTKLEATNAMVSQTRDIADGTMKLQHRFEAEFREKHMPIIEKASAFTVEAEPVIKAMKTVQYIVVTMLGLGILSIGGMTALFFYARSMFTSIVRAAIGL